MQWQMCPRGSKTRPEPVYAKAVTTPSPPPKTMHVAAAATRLNNDPQTGTRPTTATEKIAKLEDHLHCD